MKSVFEIAARYVEPSLKRVLVNKLLTLGTPRFRIASCLGISQSLITRYIKKERGLYDFSIIHEVDEKLQKLAEKIAKGELCGLKAYDELAELVIYILSKKYACGIHYLTSKDINPATCNICPTLFSRFVNE